jgi:putrescine transport system permease protein
VIFSSVRLGASPQINALATLLVLLATLLIVFATLIMRRQKFARVANKAG